MGMLETVVSEKQIARANMPSPSPMSPQISPPKRSNTMSANQRLKGLLSRSSTVTSKSIEKVRPIPDQMTSPKFSMSPSPPLPHAMPILGSAFGSASTSTLASDGTSMSTPDLNVPRDPTLSFSPSLRPIDGTEDKSDQPVEFMPPSQQNEINTPNDAARTRAPLPEIPHAEKEPEELQVP
jgi:vacuolar protein sorting-associated protein 54